MWRFTFPYQRFVVNGGTSQRSELLAIRLLLRAFSGQFTAPSRKVGCAAGTANNTVSAAQPYRSYFPAPFTACRYQAGSVPSTVYSTSRQATPFWPANDLSQGAIALKQLLLLAPITGDNTNATASPTSHACSGRCGGATTTDYNDVGSAWSLPTNDGVTVATSAAAGSTLNDTVHWNYFQDLRQPDRHRLQRRRSGVV
jgi:hypothetical protein